MITNKNQKQSISDHLLNTPLSNITEREHAAETLLKLSRAVEQTIDTIVITDREGIIEYVNHAFEVVTGYTSEEAVGKTPSILKSGTREQVYYEKMWKTILSGKVFRAEVVNKKKNGDLFYEQKTISPIFDENKTITHFVGTGIDISERKRTEEALLESEKLYRSLFENMLNGFAYCKMIFEHERPHDFIYLAVNNSFESLTGLKNVIGKKVSEVIPGIRKSDPVLFELYGRVALTGKPETIEIYVEALKMWFSISVYSPLKEHFVAVFDVITKRKIAEEVLFRSEAKFRNLINTLPDPVLIVDNQGQIVFCNENAMKKFDYSMDDMLKSAIEDLIPRNFRKHHIKLRDKFISQARSLPMGEGRELFAQRKNGSKFPTEIMLEPIEINNNQFVMAIIRDITKRKREEEELRQTHAELENLLDNLDKAIFSVDTIHNKMLQVSIAHETVFGYTQAEFFNNPQLWYEIIVPEDKPIIDAGYPVLLSGKTLRHEFRIVHADGQLRWIEAKMNPTLDMNGKLIRIDGVASDVTDRKWKEIELLEKEVQYHNLADSGLALIWTAGTDKLCNFFNLPWLKFTGRSLDQEIGDGWAEGVHPDDFDSCLKTYIAAFDNREKFDMEYRLRHASGEYRWISDLGTPNYNSNGEFIGYIGHCFDITDHKQSEQELIKAKEKAEESDRLKSAFLANMSHEVRTPLNSIIGFSELLADKGFEEEQKNEFIQHIITNGNNLLTIISDIMDISKMESGEIKIHKSQINIQKFISVIKEKFIFQTEANKLELKLNLPDVDEETLIFADVERLMQIFNNLMSNAIKFTANGRIEIGYQLKGSIVEFYVKDTGIGIPAEYHDKIFERFRQVESEKTRKYGGNGLGLAICKKLVELMGGKIWLRSESGIGSDFYFTMPTYKSEL